MADWYDEARKFIKTKVTSSDNSFGGLMAAWFASGAPNAGATVIAQTAPANIGAAPTQSDFNNLLAVLKTSGVLK